MSAPSIAVLAIFTVAAFGSAVSATAQTNGAEAYALDQGGRIVKNPFGLCWRTSQWTAAKAVPDCDRDLMAKPAPPEPEVVRAPAPVPIAAPVPTPTPPPVPAPAPAPAPVAAAPADSDGDGVADGRDKCPDSRAGAKVDASGCEVVEIAVLKGVTFATGSVVLTAASRATLDQTAAALLESRSVRAEVAGHTDNRGSPVLNRALSQRRAEAVRSYLVSKGIAAERLAARGYGPDQPVADSRTEQGRSANRRVELRILK